MALAWRASVPGLAFGCGFVNNGIFKSNETGFGPALSLPSQLKVGNFSHCFTDITGSEPSTVLLVLPANLYSNAGGVVQSTLLIQSSSSLNAYCLSLKGITVGSTRLFVSERVLSLPQGQIPESVFTPKEDWTRGTVIDSGTGMTSLPQNAYDILYDAFVAQVGFPVLNSSASSVTHSASLRHCRGSPSVRRWTWPGRIICLGFEDAGAGGNFTCLAVNAGDDMTIIGSYQQQNMHVLYDLVSNKLSFVPARCNMF
ncbi:hypothetical protein EJB05_06874, partial [Eragrostis curvula]